MCFTHYQITGSRESKLSVRVGFGEVELVKPNTFGNIFLNSSDSTFIVDSVITYTLSIGAVRKPHLPGVESVYLFLEFTINTELVILDLEDIL